MFELDFLIISVLLSLTRKGTLIATLESKDLKSTSEFDFWPRTTLTHRRAISPLLQPSHASFDNAHPSSHCPAIPVTLYGLDHIADRPKYSRTTSTPSQVIGLARLPNDTSQTGIDVAPNWTYVATTVKGMKICFEIPRR